MNGSRNLTWHAGGINKQDARQRNGHPSLVLWFTGLSGAGKSTLAHAVHEVLFRRGWQAYVLDGDNVRHGLNSDLGFSAEDRRENIRRIGEVGKLFVEAGVLVLTAFISPFREDRDRVRELLEPGDFVEIYVKCSLELCEQRDPKGLYQKAREGLIPDFTGISSPYEEPERPELVIDTGILDLEESVGAIIDYLDRHMEGRETRDAEHGLAKP